MKKTLLIFAAALIVSAAAFSQAKPKPKFTSIYPVKTDTVYVLSEKQFFKLYGLAKVGYQGVMTSRNFSEVQRDAYKADLDSTEKAILPQYLKFHPQTPAKKQ